jgi:hypothetical protein
MVEKSFLVINGKTVGLGGKASAKNVTYSNADTNLTSIDVQDAISELDRTKQEKLVGLRGQVVGFDELGNAIAQDSTSGDAYGKVYTTLEELGLDSSATLNDAINAMPFGSSALFGVAAFADYQNIFPYTESNDQYSRVYIVKSNSLSRIFCQWFMKNGSKAAIANVDSNNQVIGWERITLNPYNSNVYKTYGNVYELNAAKGISINFVANEDNTQKILDALGPREEFVEWYGNSNNRFGIDPATFGSRINCLRITKTSATNGYVVAMMDTGAVLNRCYAEGVLGSWVTAQPSLKTYTNENDLNKAKGTSITLVDNTDNTQKIIDALGTSEQFIGCFENSMTTKKFGINHIDFGENINLLKIIKYTSTDAVAVAYMDTGAVLNRLQKNGVLGNWVNVGHANKDGYEDDGTLAACGDNGETNTGVYGNGENYVNLGLSNDIMTWPNGIYRISHAPDLINGPNGAKAGRLEHFNLKRWAGNHNPYNKDYGSRTSIFYTQDGDIYTRYQESGAKAVIDGGSITVDTGWRKICMDSAPTWKSVNINSAISYTGTFEYCVKNGVCYVNYDIKFINGASSGDPVAYGLPAPSKTTYMRMDCAVNTYDAICSVEASGGTFTARSTVERDRLYRGSFSYPVA